MRLTGLALLAAVLLSFGFTASNSIAPPEIGLQIGNEAPDIVLNNPDGKEIGTFLANLRWHGRASDASPFDGFH